jgi:hypothetical protein
MSPAWKAESFLHCREAKGNRRKMLPREMPQNPGIHWRIAKQRYQEPIAVTDEG